MKNKNETCKRFIVGGLFGNILFAVLAFASLFLPSLVFASETYTRSCTPSGTFNGSYLRAVENENSVSLYSYSSDSRTGVSSCNIQFLLDDTFSWADHEEVNVDFYLHSANSSENCNLSLMINTHTSGVGLGNFYASTSLQTVTKDISSEDDEVYLGLWLQHPYDNVATGLCEFEIVSVTDEDGTVYFPFPEETGGGESVYIPVSTVAQSVECVPGVSSTICDFTYSTTSVETDVTPFTVENFYYLTVVFVIFFLAGLMVMRDFV